MSTPILMHAAPGLDADLFHAVPAMISDPFLYLEDGERRAAVTWVAEADKFEALGIEVYDVAELGTRALADAGLGPWEIDAELCVRACRRFGIGAATVPPRFPLFAADHLRASGIDVTVDAELFSDRRRVKTARQIEGIRRAQRAADAAMAVAARMIADLPASSEDVRAAMQAVCAEHGCTLPDDVIVAGGAQSAVGHEAGHGALVAGDPVVVDIWPRDPSSQCWTDMTRTFVAGGGAPSDELRRSWELAREALELVRGEVRPGITGRALWERSCEPFEAAGILTQRTAPDGVAQAEGYYHSLGHGVGLEVHERPYLSRVSDPLVAGDVIAVEPGCYRQGYGGARLEDLLLVTEDGCETVTAFPYDLAP